MRHQGLTTTTTMTMTMTRRSALALFPWLCLAAAGPGCAPAGPRSYGPAGIPDRLRKMRELRGTGDPRRQGKRASTPSRRDHRPDRRPLTS
jgi:hypothetical protein